MEVAVEAIEGEVAVEVVAIGVLATVIEEATDLSLRRAVKA